jgi:hypothetical protein
MRVCENSEKYDESSNTERALSKSVIMPRAVSLYLFVTLVIFVDLQIRF